MFLGVKRRAEKKKKERVFSKMNCG